MACDESNVVVLVWEEMAQRSRISGVIRVSKGAKSGKQAGGNYHARERLCVWQETSLLPLRESGSKQSCLLNEPTEVAQVDQQVGEGDIGSSTG